MTRTNAPTESPIARLARSLFGFALLACLLSAAAWIALLLSPPSPNAGLEQARVAILVGFSVLQAGAVALCVGAFRASQPRLHIVAALLSRMLTPWPLALALLVVLLAVNLALGPALRDVAPAIIGPFRFLLTGWSFVLALVAATLHWERLSAFWQASAPRGQGLACSSRAALGWRCSPSS